MRLAVLSLAMGILVGVAYSLVDIRSPAPPIVALLGLLGMVAGEAAADHVKDRWLAAARQKVDAAAPASKARILKAPLPGAPEKQP